MDEPIPQGTARVIDGQRRVYYDGYWIKAYPAPANTLLMKKRLIEALTRRLFNHVEHGINVPGERLEEARRAYDGETDPQRKRVKAAMLAGALFNRAADVFTKLVEIQALGVEIQPDNALMQQCGEHLQEALTLGRHVRHRSGDEGIDELWGEPLKAFLLPIEEFYRSRYVKIAMTLRNIDELADALARGLEPYPCFAGSTPLIDAFREAAKVKCETLRTDSEVFEVWTTFAVVGERLTEFEPAAGTSEALRTAGLQLILDAKRLVSYITRARAPMPKSTRALTERLERFRAAAGPRAR